MTLPARREAPSPLPFDEAARLVLGEVRGLPSEDVPLESLLGRVLAMGLRAPHALPPFTSSAVDGWAVRASDVAAASAESPVRLAIAGVLTAGEPARRVVGEGEAIRIMTGAPVPEGADALVMLEWTEWTDRHVVVRRAAAPGRNVRPEGEDVRRGEEVLPEGCVLGPAEIGMLASLGFVHAPVRRRPVVAILATGDELLEVGAELSPGRIRSSNDRMLEAAVTAAGATALRLPLARDDLDSLATRLASLPPADVLVTSGGVSVGDHDLLGDALDRLGFRRIFWRVASSPGKPLLFGRLGATLVFGLPGNPVSSAVAFENFVRPALRGLQGDPSPERPRVVAVCDERISGPEDRRHFARARLRWEDGRWRIREAGPKGSGNLGSMVAANALAIVREGLRAVEKGETVEVMMLGMPDFAAPARD